MLAIPDHATLVELETSTVWMEEPGLLCAIAKKRKSQTLEEAQASLDRLRALLGERKVCMLIDVTHTSESTPEVRAFAARELPKILTACAMVSSSALGKMLANLFFNLKSQPYPVKMFNDEAEARIWLKQFLR